MAISDISTGPFRNRIGFVRKLPPKNIRRVFEMRGYECYLLDELALDIPGQIETTDSVIISQQPEKPSHFKPDLERFSVLLNHDCRIYVRYAPDSSSQALVLDSISRLKLPPSGFDESSINLFSKEWFDPAVPLFAPFVHMLRTNVSWDLLANRITNNPAGRPPNTSLNIILHGSGLMATKLSDEKTLLLKRAFWDCSSIELFPKTDGMSDVGAFEAFARLATNIVGSQSTYRCFVKLGPRVTVAREFQKYRLAAVENVPFHLGPRLRSDRCVLGKSEGLITCDYVVGGETLRDCIRDGRGVHVIGNLFNQTLIAWRRAATDERRPLQTFLAEHLEDRKSIPEHRESMIRKYGATKTLSELKALLKNSASSEPVLVGVIHGDLHATNVLVRMNDAIIIDLERIATGQPLLFDAASLEGGLFVDGFVGDNRSPEVVLHSIYPLYTKTALTQDDHYCDPSNRSAWYVDSVRQIRMQARQMERQKHQYAWTLAASLLRKSCNPLLLVEHEDTRISSIPKLTREMTRAMAYVIAEKIILKLCEMNEEDQI